MINYSEKTLKLIADYREKGDKNMIEEITDLIKNDIHLTILGKKREREAIEEQKKKEIYKLFDLYTQIVVLCNYIHGDSTIDISRYKSYLVSPDDIDLRISNRLNRFKDKPCLDRRIKNLSTTIACLDRISDNVKMEVNRVL